MKGLKIIVTPTRRGSQFKFRLKPKVLARLAGVDLGLGSMPSGMMALAVCLSGKHSWSTGTEEEIGYQQDGNQHYD